MVDGDTFRWPIKSGKAVSVSRGIGFACCALWSLDPGLAGEATHTGGT